MPITAAAFDMDGLMFDTENLAIQGWIEAGKDFGLQLDKTIVLLTLGVDSAGTQRIFQENYGFDLDYPAIRDKRVQHTIDWIEKYGMPIKPGLKELLTYLKDNGYTTAVSSSTAMDRVLYYLNKAGVTDYFDQIVTGDQVKHGKPAPDIFLLACEKMGSRPAETIALEDSPYGIRSAHDAGCITVMVPDLAVPTPEVLQLVYRKCTTLHEVIDLLEEEKAKR